MYLALVSSSERKVSKHFPFYCFISLLLFAMSQWCRAESKDNAISSLLDKVSLGDYADFEVPEGYRFVGAEGARTLLDRMNNPVGSGLLGVLMPSEGKSLAVLEFEPIGYLKELNEQQVDFDGILKAVENRHENGAQLNATTPRIASLEWEMKPKYDSSAHSLEWAFRAGTPSGKVVNHAVALLGRRGVLEITVVQPYQISQGHMDLVPIREWAKRITFKEGQRYTDYQPGDKIASTGMQEVIAGEDEAPARHQDNLTAASSVPGFEIWIYTALGGCVALGIGVLAYKKLRKPGTAAATATNGHTLPALQPNGNNNGAKNGGAHKRNGTVRKHKDFNYSKYYSDMVMQLSGTSYHWVSPAQDHPLPRVAPTAAPQPVAGQQAVADASLELIACQRNLIEEQKNLLREQSRIIEEKARLIKEYTHLVERLSQDIDSQYSLKLD